MNEKQNIGSLFDRIAGRYDFLNHLLSFNIDRYWRRRAVASVVDKCQNGQCQNGQCQNGQCENGQCENGQCENGQCQNGKCLDVAVGTADLAICLANQFLRSKQVVPGKAGIGISPFHIVGIDLSQEMMRLGEAKVRKCGLQDRISFMHAGALAMPFADGSFDIVTCAYGVRNFSDLDKGLSEMYRVLRTGGQLMILEFSYPSNKLVAWAYDLYFSHILPHVGRLVSGDKTAYTYLNRSVRSFLWGGQMADRLRQAGFADVVYTPLTFGITTIYNATK